MQLVRLLQHHGENNEVDESALSSQKVFQFLHQVGVFCVVSINVFIMVPLYILLWICRHWMHFHPYLPPSLHYVFTYNVQR